MSIRVLVVDDSSFFRRRLTEILAADVELLVVGTANNGKEAVEKAAELKPDVITMDVEMPVMDGIQAVREILKNQRVPILILTYQIVLNHSKFPAGFGEKSRQYWNGQFDRAMALINKAERDVPAATWGDLTPENMIKYTVMLRDARIDIAEQGVYDKQGLSIIKRVRCSINAGDSECSSQSENWR